jgi:hypothetical protein
MLAVDVSKASALVSSSGRGVRKETDQSCGHARSESGIYLSTSPTDGLKHTEDHDNRRNAE